MRPVFAGWAIGLGVGLGAPALVIAWTMRATWTSAHTMAVILLAGAFFLVLAAVFGMLLFHVTLNRVQRDAGRTTQAVWTPSMEMHRDQLAVQRAQAATTQALLGAVAKVETAPMMAPMPEFGGLE